MQRYQKGITTMIGHHPEMESKMGHHDEEGNA